MPTLNNELEEDDIEYVTLEECRMLPVDNLVSEGTHFNVNGMTHVSQLRNTIQNTPGANVLVHPLFSQTCKCHYIL